MSKKVYDAEETKDDSKVTTIEKKPKTCWQQLQVWLNQFASEFTSKLHFLSITWSLTLKNSLIFMIMFNHHHHPLKTHKNQKNLTLCQNIESSNK